MLGKGLPLTITILRLRLSITPSRWSSLITLETASWWRRSCWQVLVGEAHVYQCAHTVALPKALAQVHEQRREPGRDLLCNRLSITSSDCLSRSEKEEKSLRAKPGSLFITRSMDAFDARDPRVGNGLCEDVLPASLDQVELAEDAPSLKRGRGLLVVAVDLVQTHRAREQEVELIVGIPRRKDRVLGLKRLSTALRPASSKS